MTPPTTLPVPTSSRFKPLRSGLINLFKYENQQFWYEQGRLLVRGNNGTGKSRVLALQLPFLLDGEISPSRVEPDGDRARQLAWHLHMDVHEQRTGYTWLEFGRVDESGAECYLTLGCGMKAIRGADNQPTRWFFITDRRVDRDFELVESNRPLSAEQLEDRIGEKSFYKTAREYRQAIDEGMFSLGHERYSALVDLLIRLRAPQLHKKLEEKTLYAALSDALPPLDADLIDKVASAFRDLDDLRLQHASLTELARIVVEFQTDYRRYSQAVVGRRAALVRSTHSEYEKAQRANAELERQLELARTDETNAAIDQGAAHDEHVGATTRYETLLQSPAAQEAQNLDLAKAAFDQATISSNQSQEAATRAEQALTSSEQELSEHTDEAEKASRELNTRLAAAKEAAGRAAFRRDHDEILPGKAEGWPETPSALTTLKGAHERAVKAHMLRLEQLDTLLGKVTEATGKLATLQGVEDNLAATVERLNETGNAHDQQARAAVGQLRTDYEQWRGSLRWLQPQPWATFADTISEWIETAAEENRVLPGILETVAQAEAVARAGAIQELAARRRELTLQRTKMEQERGHLLKGPPPPPLTPAVRDANARAGRRGAPFWQVCEFRPDLRDEDRAGLEAALEASGILDAWLSPEGLDLSHLPADTFFYDAASTVPPGANLTQWLIPDLPENGGVIGITKELVQRVIAQIGAGFDSTAQHWVTLNGCWRMGPLTGRGQKPVAQHLGAASREAARITRLAIVESALADLAQEEGKIVEGESALNERASAADGERKRAPSDYSIAELLVIRTSVRRDLVAAHLKHGEAQTATEVARGQVNETRTRLERDARDLGFQDYLDRLPSLRVEWQPYALSLAELWPAADKRLTALIYVAQTTARRARDAETVAQANQRWEDARRSVIAAETTYQTLRERMGSTIEEFQLQLGIARTARTTAEKAETDANKRLSHVREKRANLEGQVAPAKAAQQAAASTRDQAISDLRLPMHHGLFTEARPEFADIDHGSWSVSQAIEIARRVDRELPDAALRDAEWTHVQNELQVRLNDLRTRAGPLGCQARSEMVAADLALVVCTFHGVEHSPASLGAAVGAELSAHERLLNDRERGIIETHLVSEVSAQLQSLINRARERSDLINAELTRCATTLGFSLRLLWEPLTEGLPAGLPQVRQLILADHAAWTEDERRAVGNFLHQLIQDERTRDPAALWSEHLGRALDYRKWHTFGAQRKANGVWQRLNRQRYGTGSGGEKALMLTIPQMAAAASHYHSAAAHAPRLILLDEAFAGMDKPTRARCLGLLEPAAFDLDLVMTSEREWGAHSTVSGIAIYQLVADSDAIAATRWIWNGRQRLLAPVPDSPEFRSIATSNESSDDSSKQ